MANTSTRWNHIDSQQQQQSDTVLGQGTHGRVHLVRVPRAVLASSHAAECDALSSCVTSEEAPRPPDAAHVNAHDADMVLAACKEWVDTYGVVNCCALREMTVLTCLPPHPCVLAADALVSVTPATQPRALLPLFACDAATLVEERYPQGVPEPVFRAAAMLLLAGVRHLHSHGVLHRDIKLQNVLVGPVDLDAACAPADDDAATAAAAATMGARMTDSDARMEPTHHSSAALVLADFGSARCTDAALAQFTPAPGAATDATERDVAQEDEERHLAAAWARALPAAGTTGGLGTLCTRAPELCWVAPDRRSHATTPATDVWSAAATLLAMACGQYMSDGRNEDEYLDFMWHVVRRPPRGTWPALDAAEDGWSQQRAAAGGSGRRVPRADEEPWLEKRRRLAAERQHAGDDDMPTHPHDDDTAGRWYVKHTYSVAAWDFLLALLQPVPFRRLSAAAALQHPYLAGMTLADAHATLHQESVRARWPLAGGGLSTTTLCSSTCSAVTSLQRVFVWWRRRPRDNDGTTRTTTSLPAASAPPPAVAASVLGTDADAGSGRVPAAMLCTLWNWWLVVGEADHVAAYFDAVQLLTLYAAAHCPSPPQLRDAALAALFVTCQLWNVSMAAFENALVTGRMPVPPYVRMRPGDVPPDADAVRRHAAAAVCDDAAHMASLRPEAVVLQVPLMYSLLRSAWMTWRAPVPPAHLRIMDALVGVMGGEAPSSRLACAAASAIVCCPVPPRAAPLAAAAAYVARAVLPEYAWPMALHASADAVRGALALSSSSEAPDTLMYDARGIVEAVRNVHARGTPLPTCIYVNGNALTACTLWRMATF